MSTLPRPRRVACALAVALAALAVHPHDAGAQSVGCPVAGSSVTLRRVRVQPTGRAPLELTVTRQPVRASFVPGLPEVAVEVAGALTFQGSSPTTPVSVVREVTVADGTVTLTPHASVATPRPHSGTSIVVDAVLDSVVTLRNVAVPCAALMLDAPRPGPDASPRRGRDGPIWLARGRRLALRAAPGGPVVVRAEGASITALMLTEVDRRGPWVRVHQEFGGGSRMIGWVAAEALRPVPNGGFSGSISSCSACGMCGAGSVGALGVFEGDAQVAQGTAVSSQFDGQGPWATVTTSAPLRVRHVVGDPWVRLVAVPGIATAGSCNRLEAAWVPRAAVRFPPEAGAR